MLIAQVYWGQAVGALGRSIMHLPTNQYDLLIVVFAAELVRARPPRAGGVAIGTAVSDGER